MLLRDFWLVISMCESCLDWPHVSEEAEYPVHQRQHKCQAVRYQLRPGMEQQKIKYKNVMTVNCLISSKERWYGFSREKLHLY
jgi:hypothetical protein